MRHFVSAACGMWLGCAAPVGAEPVVVVELYTSQGCSSCPPADEFLAMLASDPRILPLALHVDYWDYIGWADKFAQPKFTTRQKAYAHSVGSRSIYTPQLIIGGQDRIEGYAPQETEAQLKRHLSAPAVMQMTAQRTDDTLAIHVDAQPGLDAPVQVQLVRYIPAETVTIERGENAGRTITYYNIVTSWEVVAEWTGEDPLDLTETVTGNQPTVVILQAPGPAAILAAVRVE